VGEAQDKRRGILGHQASPKKTVRPKEFGVWEKESLLEIKGVENASVGERRREEGGKKGGCK